MSEDEIARELAAYQVELTPAALKQLSCYLQLLLRWNQRINLTAYRDPRQIVRRLFGESLFLARIIEVRGWLVDVGAGAGFPGLALKLDAPELRVTLIESRRKKGAFLREVARRCAFSNVDVVVERFETWVRGSLGPERPSIATTRAVVVSEGLVEGIGALLAGQGKAVFLTTASDAADIRQVSSDWLWEPDFRVPQTSGSVVLIGTPVHQ
jgi:16S rRNA (guanine527-N7)-methyltransferase